MSPRSARITALARIIHGFVSQYPASPVWKRPWIVLSCSLRDATHASTFLTKLRSASKHSLIIEKLSALVSGSRWENCCSCSRSVFVIGYRTDRKTSIVHTADLHGCLVVTSPTFSTGGVREIKSE